MTDWTEWNGVGFCPVAPNTKTKIRFRNWHEVSTTRPQDWMWGRAPSQNIGEIVAYCIVQEPAIAD